MAKRKTLLTEVPPGVPTLTQFGIIYTDATEKRIYPIIARDIIPTMASSPEYCAIAMAIKRIDGVPEVHIYNELALVVTKLPVGFQRGMEKDEYEPGVGIRYFQNQYTMKARKSYDTGALHWYPYGGKPAILLPPPPSRRLGYRKGKSGTNKRSGNGGNPAYLSAAGLPRMQPTRKIAP